MLKTGMLFTGITALVLPRHTPKTWHNMDREGHCTEVARHHLLPAIEEGEDMAHQDSARTRARFCLPHLSVRKMNLIYIRKFHHKMARCGRVTRNFCSSREF